MGMEGLWAKIGIGGGVTWLCGVGQGERRKTAQVPEPGLGGA